MSTFGHYKVLSIGLKIAYIDITKYRIFVVTVITVFKKKETY